ncbi:GNAT family N-acetyltransferase [Actinoplanes sp. TBRC 11911]|uniref:GNAT family N-acetyltransferase n=1 Tax=Actinoplanes sp. TBRC 11911 TaxID=2729386 RepID=UPI00145E688B|nr:GNAT family N-acetyltransferase [Actinoplanes sp. TBRC 11911]NMO55751.1 GNAT family N-acetyltransferase [Actinoplanes sp. TBRC 11911]
MPELIAPTVRLHRAWLEAHAEWGPGLHEDGFGLTATDEVETQAGFAAWVRRLDARSDRCVFRWIVEDGSVLGGLALRHGDSEAIARAGHVGYGLRPSARGRGLGSWTLARALDEARILGIPRLLAVCAIDNQASARTIERGGGVLEGVRDGARRYWIAL